MAQKRTNSTAVRGVAAGRVKSAEEIAASPQVDYIEKARLAWTSVQDQFKDQPAKIISLASAMLTLELKDNKRRFESNRETFKS